jgi:mRNA interferase RelE/StbE
MDNYAVVFTRSARKELEQFDQSLINRILMKIETLSEDPRPNDCRKLRGKEKLWRLRVGDYRIIYSIDDMKRTVDIFSIRHRRDAYR